MNKDQAIRLLNQQLTRINENFDQVHWTETTQAIITKIFPNTFQEKRDQLDDISYRANTPHSFREFEEAAMARGKNRAREYITSYIEEIQTFGIELDKSGDNHPITSLIKNGYFWTAIAAIGSLAFYSGNYIGTTKFDKEKLEYYQKVDELKKSNEGLKEQIRAAKSRISSDSIKILQLIRTTNVTK